MNWEPGWIDQGSYLCPEDLPGEEWKPFTHFKGRQLQPFYEISNLGRIRSTGIRKHIRILAGTYDESTGGYVATRLQASDKSPVSVSYHMAVAHYFLDPPDGIEDPTVDHIDSNHLDNRVSNLQWLSRGDNSRKAIADGLCEPFMNNGGWNKQSCHFTEYPEIHFKSLHEAATFIGRNSDYVAECIRLSRPIKRKSDGKILNVVLE